MKQFILLLGCTFAFSLVSAEENVAADVSNTDAKEIKLSVDESKVPVLTRQKEKAAPSSSPYFRLILSFGVIAGMAAGLIFFSRWFTKRSGGNDIGQKIELLSQLHLGPRKSIAMIRVSGESILVGITDQNIRLIKGLSLMDEDIGSEISPTNFKDQLQRQSSDIADMDLRSIKDQITRKTNSMRQLT